MSAAITILNAKDTYRLVTNRDCKVIDATWYMPEPMRNAYQDYLSAHIPGAQFFDIDDVTQKSTDLPHMLPTPNDFAAAMSAMGISNTDPIIVYDQSPVRTAARLAWMLKAFGHHDIAILDGGLESWRNEGLPLEAGQTQPHKASYTANVSDQFFCDWKAVKAATSCPSDQIIDARAADRFQGLVVEPRAGLRSGHIPSSGNLPFGRLFDASGCYKSNDEIIAEFEKAGIDMDKPIITSCGSGITACVLAVALEKVGKKDVTVYDGSWTQWGGRDDLPIETGVSD